MADLSVAEMKTCRTCGETKPSYEFHLDRQKKGGRRNQCRLCTNQDHAEKRYGRLARKVYEYKPFGRFVMVPGVITLAKTCPKCGVLRQAVDFTRSRATSDGLCSTCRYCNRQWWASREPDVRAASKRVLLMRLYGLTPDEFDRLLIEQSGRCAICSEPMMDDLAIDHDHRTGAVRGLLDGFCNRGLGMFRDDPQRLRAAAEYLEGAEPFSLWVSRLPTSGSFSKA